MRSVYVKMTNFFFSFFFISFTHNILSEIAKMTKIALKNTHTHTPLKFGSAHANTEIFYFAHSDA
jgi:hypothetical protein